MDHSFLQDKKLLPAGDAPELLLRLPDHGQRNRL